MQAAPGRPLLSIVEIRMQLKQFDAIDTVPTVPLRAGSRRSMRISHRDARNLRTHSRLQRASARRSETSRNITERETFVNSAVPASQRKEEEGSDEADPGQVSSNSPEDAWLNDVGPVSQSAEGSDDQSVGARFIAPPSPSAPRPRNGSALAADKRTRKVTPAPPLVAIDLDPTNSICSPNYCAREEYIGCDYRLWPVVLHLSQHIWEEMYQKRDMVPARERAEIEHVRKRSLDLLRAELRLASQIQDRDEAEQVLGRVVDEVLGYGPLEELLKDEDVSEIMVVGSRLTYVERNGKVEEVPNHFEDDSHVLRIVENVLRQAGRCIEEKRPIADVRLPDGSLVNIVLPPSAVKGPAITIRKYTKRPLDMADLVSLGSMTQEMADFLSACVQARLNIVICGGMSSGRTTLLGALGSCIAAEERIVTIEDVAELQLSQRHVVALQVRAMQPADSGSSEQLSMRDLVIHTLHMRPERIIVDECRESETVEMLQAMYAGYDGSLITMYAHNVRDCLARLEMMWLVYGKKLPLPMMRARIASSLDVIVCLLRLSDGSRKIMNISEVQGVDGDRIKLQSIFHYGGMNVESGKPEDAFRPSGFRPTFMSKLEAGNIHLPDEIFVPRHDS